VVEFGKEAVDLGLSLHQRLYPAAVVCHLPAQLLRQPTTITPPSRCPGPGPCPGGGERTDQHFNLLVLCSCHHFGMRLLLFVHLRLFDHHRALLL
jgi:hypothetical protein